MNRGWTRPRSGGVIAGSIGPRPGGERAESPEAPPAVDALWVHDILSRQPQAGELAALLRPAVREILGPEEPAYLGLYERQLHEDAYRIVSFWPGGGIDRSVPPGGPSGGQDAAGVEAQAAQVPRPRAILPPELKRAWRTRPSIQVSDRGVRTLLVPAHGFRDLCGFLEILPAAWQSASDAPHADALLLLGRLAGLCLERRRVADADKLREKALEALVGFLGRFSHRISDGILIISAEGTCLHLNRSAERMTGILGINAAGRDARQILPLPVAQALARACKEAVHCNRSTPRDVEFMSPGGAARWRLEVEAIRSGGSVISHVATLRDLGDRERLARLLELDRLKNDFLSTLSHELRTPMTTLRGYTWLLKQEHNALPEHLREAVTAMDRDASGLCTMIENLLFVADPDPMRLDDAGPVSVGSLVKEVVEEVSGRTAHRGVRLECEAASERLLVRGDASRIRLMVVNLVDNAVKFSPAEGCVRVTWQAADGESGVLRVSDEGPGLSRALGPMAFDPFQQGGDSLVDKTPGLGLGLSIVRRVVGEHGGRLELEARAEGGTTIAVILPLADDTVLETTG